MVLRASIVVPLAYVVLPRLGETAARHGCMTPADVVPLRTGLGSLALVVALTGVLATMPCAYWRANRAL